jgi:vacuolar-type H+-ATPase subunit E/Vma4
MHDFEGKSVLEKLKEYFDLKFEEQKKEITDLKNEISKLKVEQREMIRETIKSTIQEEFAKILNEDKEKLFDKIDALKAKAENVDAGTLEKLKNEINKMIE